MRLIVKAKEGEDIARHMRVFARVRRITELVIHLETSEGVRFIEATIRRTNTPYEQRDLLIDVMSGTVARKLCGLFSITTHHLPTNKTEHNTTWIAVEK